MKFTHLFIEEASGEIVAENFDVALERYQTHRYCYDITANFNSNREARRISLAVLLGHWAKDFNRGSKVQRKSLVSTMYQWPNSNYSEYYKNYAEVIEEVETEDQHGL